MLLNSNMNETGADTTNIAFVKLYMAVRADGRPHITLALFDHLIVLLCDQVVNESELCGVHFDEEVDVAIQYHEIVQNLANLAAEYSNSTNVAVRATAIPCRSNTQLSCDILSLFRVWERLAITSASWINGATGSCEHAQADHGEVHSSWRTERAVQHAPPVCTLTLPPVSCH